MKVLRRYATIGFSPNDFPDKVTIDPGPGLVADARDVFSTEEYEARVERYAARAAKGLPLFQKEPK